MSHFFTKPKRDQLSGLENIDETTLSSATVGDVLVAKDDAGTIRFVNVVSTAADAATLPAAADYPGKTCVAQDTGKLHYSDGTEWKALGLDGEGVELPPTASAGEVLQWVVPDGGGDGGWAAQMLDVSTSLDGLTNVDTVGVTDGQVLAYDEDGLAWVAVDPAAADLPAGTEDGQILSWDNTGLEWEVTVAPSGFNPTGDEDYEVLVWDNTALAWESRQQMLAEHSDVRTDMFAENGYVLKWDGIEGRWDALPDSGGTTLPDGTTSGDMLVWMESGVIESPQTMDTPTDKLIAFYDLDVDERLFTTGTTHLTTNEDGIVVSLSRPELRLVLGEWDSPEGVNWLILPEGYADVKMESDGNVQISNDHGASWEDYPTFDFHLYESSDDPLPAPDGFGFMGQFDFVSEPTPMAAGTGSGSDILWVFNSSPSGSWTAQPPEPVVSTVYACEASEFYEVSSGTLGIVNGDGNNDVHHTITLDGSDTVWVILNEWNFDDGENRNLTLTVPYNGVEQRRQLFIVNRETNEDARTVFLSIGKDDGTDDSTLQGSMQTLEIEPGVTTRLVCVETGPHDAHWILA